MDISIWSRPYLGQSGLNRSRYNEVRVFNEFSMRVSTREFHENLTGNFLLIFSHKWVPLDIWIWSRPYLGQSGLNRRVSTREFHENFTGKFLLIFSHKWVPMDIWIWSRPYLGQSELNRSRYNEVQVFDEFSKGLGHENFLKISPGKLIFSHKWVFMNIWICSRPYFGQSGLNRSWYNEVRVFNEFSKGLVHGNFSKLSLGSFFWYFHINGSLWIYEFGHDHIWGNRDWIGASIMKFEFLTNSQRG